VARERQVILNELSKARQAFALDSSLHILYHVSPISHGIEPSWPDYHAIYAALDPCHKRVGDLVGVSEQLLTRFVHLPPARQAVSRVRRTPFHE